MGIIEILSPDSAYCRREIATPAYGGLAMTERASPHTRFVSEKRGLIGIISSFDRLRTSPSAFAQGEPQLT